MIKTLKRVGNSHSITIEKPLMAQMGIRAGSRLQVLVDGRNLVISPIDDCIDDGEFDRALRAGMKQYDKALRKLS